MLSINNMVRFNPIQCRECTPALLHLQLHVQDLAQHSHIKGTCFTGIIECCPVWQPDVVVFPFAPPPKFVGFLYLFFPQSCISMHINALVEDYF